MKPVLTVCPLCTAPLEKMTGLIEEPVLSPYRDGRAVKPVTRLGTYVLCTGCEFGEEVR